MDLTGFLPLKFSKNHLVNESGDVYSLLSNRLLIHQIKNECHAVAISSKTYYIHRLVMMTFAFQDGCEQLYVNHKDKNRSNNHISNLEWCTQKENLDWNKINPTLSYLTYKKKEYEEVKNLEGEIWFSINENYQISNKQRVKSLDKSIVRNGRISLIRGKLLTPQLFSNGYLFIILYDKGKGSPNMIHRLMATAFIPNPLNLPCVNHKDGNKTNNTVENLEWIDKRGNMIHAVEVLGTGRRGEMSPTSKFKEHQIRKVVELYKKGYSKSEASRISGVSEAIGLRVINGTAWKHLKLI